MSQSLFFELPLFVIIVAIAFLAWVVWYIAHCAARQRMARLMAEDTLHKHGLEVEDDAADCDTAAQPAQHQAQERYGHGPG